MNISTIGLDLAKNVFQVHGIDSTGKVIAQAEQIRELEARIAMLEGEIKTWFRDNELAKRLATIPGIGFITASALAASVTDPHRRGPADWPDRSRHPRPRSSPRNCPCQ